MAASVVLICGLPGSGKSTLAREVSRNISTGEDPTTCQHIEYDAVQESLDAASGNSNDGESLEAWRQSRSVALEELSSLLEQRSSHQIQATEASAHHCILMDDNFYLRSMRKQVYKICQRHRAHMGILWIDCPIDVCLQRNAQRRKERMVSESIIRGMPVEKPDSTSSWEANVLVSELTMSSDNDVDKALKFLNRVRNGKPVPPVVDPQVEEARLSRERQSTAASLTHQLDQMLRVCVSTVAQLYPPKARYANKAKQELGQKLKERKQNGDLAEFSSDAVHDAFCDTIQALSGCDWTTEEITLIREKLRSTGTEF